jgi:DNA modification methylase
MTPPPTIHISQIDEGERIRKTYNKIEELADSIEGDGLIQPLVLVPLGNRAQEVEMSDETIEYEVKEMFGLDAGGRRTRALKLLHSEDRWDGILYHAATSEPGRPGYVLKGEDQRSPLKRLMTEIAENLNREDPDWRDQIHGIVKAWKLAKADADSKSERLLMADFGAMLGVGYSNLQAAVYIYDDFISNPERYEDVNYLREGYRVLLRENTKEVVKLQAIKSMQKSPVQVPSESKLEDRYIKTGQREGKSEPVDVPTINLSSSFHNIDSFKFMNQLPPESFDHIYTDPDYAIDVDRLSANSDSMAAGVSQDDVNSSLLDLYHLISEAFRLIKPQGFFVFWYDLDHHEKLQRYAIEAGFAVQRWPLTWVKSDYRSNASPQCNFTKNEEWAMVCRKHNACLTGTQSSSVWTGPSANVQRLFHHPFAKPLELHHWILSAIAIKGQSVYDPFMGSGSILVAAARFGLRPVGTEINVDHYSNGIMNLQAEYKRLVGGEVNFS